ncbi:MAG: hypothetical protein QOE90_1118 [Thermoplasmata archaeon]|jgi:uncharacterized protein YecE (DUF72 family)|nr:hypothetical protein [Thermoplasmata archaeon]
MSGWSYPEWVGPFYPVSLRGEPSAWLAHYARHFRAVEINSTFYAMPGEELVASWARQGVQLLERGPFEFSLKLPRDVTHRALPQGDRDAARELTGRFDREVLDPLAGEGLLGAVLVQLPPRLPPTPPVVRALQDVVAALAERAIAVEVRDGAWLDHGVLVEAAQPAFGRDVALVQWSGGASADPRDAPRAPTPASHAYIRFHGRKFDPEDARPHDEEGARYDHLYAPEDLRPWAEHARRLAQDGRDVRVFFNNTTHAKGTRNAMELLEMLGQAPAGLAKPRLTEQTRLEV